MYRLTERKSNGFVTLGERPRVECDEIFCGYASKCDKVMDRSCPHIVAVDRLADYEDTGLMPNEVSKLKSDLAQTRQYLREALDIAKANAQLFDDACAERDEAIKCIKDYEMYYGRGDEERARHVLEKWVEEESK